MFPRAIRVAVVGGVDVRVDPSWLLVAVAVVIGYRSTFATDDRSALLAVLLALVTALLFSVSVLVHELAHALEGTHRGAEVAGITLFVLGGVTALHGEDRTARDEFAIAAIGPWSNLVLAAAAGLLATGFGELGWDAAAQVAGVMGWLNLGLALFNLVPGAPLDGGRVLRAGVWALTGDRHRATAVAAAVGVVMSVLLLGFALFALTSLEGGVWTGLWTGAIGAYTLRASVVEWRRGRLGRWLAGRGAVELAPAAPTVGPTATAGDATALLRGSSGAAATNDSDGRTHPVGAVLVVDGHTAVGFATPDELDGVDPDAPIVPLLRRPSELPWLEQDATGDQLANLLDRHQPFVLLDTDGAPVLSSLRAIDRRVQAAKRAELR